MKSVLKDLRVLPRDKTQLSFFLLSKVVPTSRQSGMWGLGLECAPLILHPASLQLPQTLNSVFGSPDVNTCTVTNAHIEYFFNSSFIER